MKINPEFEEQPKQVGLIGQEKTYITITFGCQMNEHDTEVMAGLLESIGYSSAESTAAADLIVINTCAVRRKPEEKVGALLGKLKALKEKKKGLTLAVGGCMAQQPEAAAYLKKRFPFVDLIFGTHALPRLPLLLEQASRRRTTLVDIEEHDGSRTGLPVRRARRFQAWLPVIYGCNNYCSYCIVPYVRGRERSRPMEEILTEARTLAEQGCLELTLLGQNVNSYGLDRPEKYDFADLLAALDRVDGLARIRFMTSHPKDLSPRLIEVLRTGRKICEHFHLPAQSGSNRILELMNRRYTREHYLELLETIREAVPGAAITTDLIVGFPGETKEDFTATAELVEKARFDNAFIFAYSPRRGTKAAELEDKLTRAEKNERLQVLSRLQQRISREINEKLVGHTVEVLGEGRSKSNAAMQTGRTRTNKLVHFPCGTDLSGKLVTVRVSEARTWNLTGKMA